MILRRRTIDVKPWWLNGSDSVVGDKLSIHDDIGYFSPAEDRETVFIFMGDVPRSMDEARKAVTYV